jgi:hypothetical protein
MPEQKALKAQEWAWLLRQAAMSQERLSHEQPTNPPAALSM